METLQQREPSSFGVKKRIVKNYFEQEKYGCVFRMIPVGLYCSYLPIVNTLGPIDFVQIFGDWGHFFCKRGAGLLI